MDIDRFLAKPVEVQINGETIKVLPLTTEFYPVFAKLMHYNQRILVAKKALKKGEELDVCKIFTPEELAKRAEIEKEIAFRTMQQTFEDLTEGDEVEGSVTNVVDFGAFIDIGLKNSALLHISEMSDTQFISHPSQLVKVGDKIYSGDEQPIMVILTERDKYNITNMAPEMTRYAEYPDHYDPEEIHIWMTEETDAKEE